jgi:hypothetical protein
MCMCVCVCVYVCVCVCVCILHSLTLLSRYLLDARNVSKNNRSKTVFSFSYLITNKLASLPRTGIIIPYKTISTNPKPSCHSQLLATRSHPPHTHTHAWLLWLWLLLLCACVCACFGCNCPFPACLKDSVPVCVCVVLGEKAVAL